MVTDLSFTAQKECFMNGYHPFFYCSERVLYEWLPTFLLLLGKSALLMVTDLSFAAWTECFMNGYNHLFCCLDRVLYEWLPQFLLLLGVSAI